jgi:hypothetical protein
MSYATMPTFEGTSIGVRRLRTLSGAGHMLGGLGAISSTMASMAIASGYSQSDIDLLSSVGATDQDIANLMSGIVTIAQLYSNYGVSIPSAAAPSSGISINPAVPPPPPRSSSGTPGYSIPANAGPAASGSSAQIPSGTQLLYQVSYTEPIYDVANLLLPTSAVISQLSSKISSYGMVVTGSQVTDNGPSTFAITISVQVIGNGFALQNDAYSILHNAMLAITGNIVGDSLGIVSRPSAGASSNVAILPIGTPTFPGATPTPAAVLQSWGPWIGIGLLGMLVVGIVFEKRI